ncbi:hypothetical protein BC940DRAFT_233832 [Gongronella butleri]|nr:hypothetical protein BC940DRAFT_233832 [Gongronella butleri]
MLESVVSTLLNRFLGAYVANLNYNQLQIGIWSGFIGELTLHIPWSNLKGQSVTINVKDVYLLAVPRDQSNVTPEDLDDREHQVKMRKLADMDMLQGTVASESPELKNDTFFNQLITRIMNNIQFSVNNIHLRYEDDLSVPGHRLAIGLTLSELSAITTDENWIPRTISDAVHQVHKLATLESLSIYWDTDATSMVSSLIDAGNKDVFQQGIATKSKTVEARQYILKPVSGTGRVKFSKSFNNVTPKVDGTLLFDELAFALDNEQYHDAIWMLDSFHSRLKRQKFLHLRPPNNSTPKTHPREYFKYAIRAVHSEIHERHARWSWDRLKERRDDRKQYVRTFVACKLERATTEEADQLASLERKLGFDDIRFYRSIARHQLKRERALMDAEERLRQELATSRRGQQQGWLSSWWYGQEANTEEGQSDPQAGPLTLTDEQKQELYDAIDYDEDKALIAESVHVPEDTKFLVMQISLNKGSFAIKRHPHTKQATDVASIVFDSVLLGSTVYTSSWKVSASLGDLQFFDGITENTKYPQLIGVNRKNDNNTPSALVAGKDANPFFFMEYEYVPLDKQADYAVTLVMRNIDIIYNPVVVREVVSFLKPPDTHADSIRVLVEAAGETLENFKKQTRSTLTLAIEQHKTINLHVDMDAPVIVIPESCSQETAYGIVIDAGHINIESQLVAPETVKAMKDKKSSGYTTEDQDQLRTLMYDRFIMKLSQTKILVGDSVDTCLEQMRNPRPELEYLQLLERIDMSFLLELCIMNLMHDLPKFRVSGNLPLLSINFSDTKYRVLMQLPQLIAASGLFNQDDGDFSPGSDTNESQPIDLRLKLWDTDAVDYFVDSDSEYNEYQASTPQGPFSRNETRATTPDAFENADEEIGESEASYYKDKQFEMYFQVDKAMANVFQAQATSATSMDHQKLLCTLSLDGLSFSYLKRPLDTTMDLKLQSLDVLDQMNHGCEFKHLASSSQNALSGSPDPADPGNDGQKQLVHLNFIQVDKRSPEYHSVFQGSDRMVKLTLSTLNFIITRSSVLELYDYSLKTFTDTETGNPSPSQRRFSQLSFSKTQPGPMIRSPQRTQVEIYLDTVTFILNDDDRRIATGELSHGDLQIMMIPDKMKVLAKFANFTLTDDSESPQDAYHRGRHLITIQGNELIDLQYETFPRSEASLYPGYDQSLYLRMGSAQFTFLEKPVCEVLTFLSKFVTMKNIYDKARQAALDTAQQQYDDATKMHFDIVIRSPVIIFPDAHGHALDVVVAYLGEIWASNAFIVDKEGCMNLIKTGLRKMHLTSKYHYANNDTMDGQKCHLQTLPIVDDINLDMDIGIPLVSILKDGGTIQPKRSYMDARGELSNVKMNLTSRQYKFLLDATQMISRVYGQIQSGEADESVGSSPSISSTSGRTNSSEPYNDTQVTNAPNALRLDMCIKMSSIELELFSDDEKGDAAYMIPTSLSTFALNNTSISIHGYMDGRMDIKLQTGTLTMNDTRPSIKSQFKQIIPPVKHGHQFIVQCDISSPSQLEGSIGRRHGIVFITINEPKMILSLDHVFLLLKFFTRPINNDSSLAQQTASGDRNATTGDSIGEEQGLIDFSYRLNITNVEFILLDDPDSQTSEAVILSADKIMISQQTVMALAVKQIGMFLCKMDSRNSSTLRFIQPFDLSVSMNNMSAVPDQQPPVELEMDVDLLVLRLSYRDTMLVASIFSKAFDLYKQTPNAQQVHTADYSIESRVQPAAARRKSMLVNESLRVSFQGMQVILIEDIHEFPMIDMAVKPFYIEAKDWSRSLEATVDFSTYVNYFNIKNSHWEPLVEPWQFTLGVSKKDDQVPLQVRAISSTDLNVNITHTFLESTMALISMFGERKNLVYTGERGHDSPYRLCNRTGYDIHIWNSNQNGDVVVRKIENNKDTPWWFDDWRKRREMTDTVNNILNVQIEGALWETLRSIHVDTEGEHMYPLRPLVRNVQHHIVFDVKLVDNVKVVTIRSTMVIENRTLLPVDLTVLDSRGYSDGTFTKIGPGDVYALPIERAYHHRFCIRPDAGFGYKWTGHAIHWTDFTKNDEYKKTISCVSEEGRSDLSPFIFQIFAKLDKTNALFGRYPAMKICLCAPVEIENLLPFDFNFRIIDKTARQDYNSFLRKNGSIPLHIMENKHLLLLNIQIPDSDYSASDFAIISTKGSEDLEIEDKLQLKHRTGATLTLHIHMIDVPDSGGARKYSIYSPYIIVNKSGYPITLKPKLAWQSSMFATQMPNFICHPASTPQPFMYSYPKHDNRNRSLMQVPGSDWSQPLSFEAVRSANDVTMATTDHNEEYHVGIHVQEGTGKYKLTKIVTVTPRFILSNRTNAHIRYRETESRADHEIPAHSRTPLYRLRRGDTKQLCIKLPGINHSWSAPFNIQDIGKVHVRLPDVHDTTVSLIRVTTILEDAMIFIILDDEQPDQWPYLLVNQTSEDIAISQENPVAVATDDSGYTFYSKPKESKQYILPANSALSYSWDMPAMKEKRLILGINGRERSVSLQEIGVQPPFRYSTKSGRPAIASIDIKTQKSRQILQLSPFNQNSSLFRPLPGASSSKLATDGASVSSREEFETIDLKTVTSFQIEVKLARIGVSLINKSLQELAYLSLKNGEMRITDSSQYQSIRCKIEWMQIDNQLYETSFPILLYPSNLTKNNNQELVPTFQLALDRVKDDSHGVLYLKYFSLLLQELKVEMDEEFIHAIVDFVQFNVPGWSAPDESALWEYTTDIPDAKENEDNAMLYFELLTIQPIRIDLSFLRSTQSSTFESQNDLNPALMFFVNILTLAIGNVNNAPVRFNALVIENIMATQGDLSNRIFIHYSDQFVYQIHRMIGSADFLGNPVGLFNNLSSGVAELFYEPWQGLIMSDRPQDLGLGIVRGFSGFFRKSVFGVTDSFTKFTGSIGKGLSAATMDRDYQERRRLTMARNRPQHAFGGVAQGANYFASSIASGVTGLVTQPIEGASKEGVGGFFTGVGKGLIGAVTKPVVGVFDLASNVTEGIRNTTTPSDTNMITRVRNPRYIGQSGVLKPYSLKEAQGQSWLKTVQGGKYFDDAYIAHCPVQNNDRIAMLTSNRLMILRTNYLAVEWQEPFTDIQTIKCEPTGIGVYLRSMTWEPFLVIPDKKIRDWFFKKIQEAVSLFNANQKMK